MNNPFKKSVVSENNDYNITGKALESHRKWGLAAIAAWSLCGIAIVLTLLLWKGGFA